MRFSIKAFVAIALFLLVAGCTNRGSSMSVGTSINSWSQIRNDSSRNAFTQQNLQIPMIKKWKKAIDNGDETAPYLVSICSGTYLITRYRNGIECIDSNSGNILWRTSIKGSILAEPKIDGRHVICCLILDESEGKVARPWDYEDKSDLICFELETGKTVWRMHIPDRVRWGTIENYCLAQGRVMVIGDSGYAVHILVVRSDTGAVEKELSSPGSIEIHGFPVFADGEILITGFDRQSDNYCLIAVDINSGLTKWKNVFDTSVIIGGVAGDDAIVMPLSTKGAIAAINTGTGALHWQRPPYNYSNHHEIAYSLSTNSVIYNVIEKDAQFLNAQFLTAIALDSGEVLWRVQASQGTTFIKPIIANNTGAVILQETVGIDKLLFFNPQDGRILQSIQINGAKNVMVAGHTIFVDSFVEKDVRGNKDTASYLSAYGHRAIR